MPFYIQNQVLAVFGSKKSRDVGNLSPPREAYFPSSGQTTPSQALPGSKNYFQNSQTIQTGSNKSRRSCFGYFQNHEDTNSGSNPLRLGQTSLKDFGRRAGTLAPQRRINLLVPQVERGVGAIRPPALRRSNDVLFLLDAQRLDDTQVGGGESVRISHHAHG